MSAHYVITMPQLSDTMTEGVVVTWEKNPGDKVSRGDIVATVETDKAIMDVEVFTEGYLVGPMVEVGATVLVGGALGYISDTQGDVSVAEDEVVTNKVSVEIVPHDSGTPILMPQLSDTMTEGTVVTWDKAIGDKVSRGDIVATVETDKAIMDVEIFTDGFLSGPLAGVDSVIQVGHPMAFIVADQEKVSTSEVTISANHQVAEKSAKTEHVAVSKPVTAPQSVVQTDISQIPQTSAKPAARPANRYASPYARKIASQMGVDLNQVSATGPNGVIVSADVAKSRPSMAEVAHQLPQVQVPGQGRAMTSMEKAVAHSMTAALTLPTFHATFNIKPEKLIAAAKARSISVTVAIAKACSVAMQKHPMLNCTYQPIDKIVERTNHDFGLAVAADGGGLVVPILHNVEQKSLEQLQAEWSDLMPRARMRKLAPAEYANPTFTISNMGMFGVTHFTAIPTPGIAAIMAIAANGPEGMPVTITADHRVVNGAHVAAYLADLKKIIESPETWMSEGSQAPASPIPEGNWDVQVVVIGGGPGGEDCARDLVEHGVKVAMINNAPLPGGECLWRGCIPSKAWRHAADIIRNRTHDAAIGITGTDKPKLAWDALETHRKSVLQTRGEMALKTDIGVKIDVREGFASFVDDHTIEIKPAEGKPYKMTFGAAVIATGAPPFVPPIPGAKECLATGGVITSDTVWNLPKPPKKLGVIGGGAIGIEMAQIFHDFGTEVILLEGKDRPLMEVEEEIAKHLNEILKQEFKVETSAKIIDISGKPGKMALKYTNAEGTEETFACDYVLMATGKRPDTAALNLEKAGVVLDGAAIKADTQCRTNVPHIYGVGDVIGGYMLAHTAATQGRVAAANLTGETLKYNQDLDCGVIFSRPEAGFVGLSVAQAKAKGIDAVEAKMPMSIDAKAMISLETQGMIKLVADKATQKIIGVHFLADHTDTLIGEAVMMVSAGITLTQAAQAIHPHPTQTELFGELARRLQARLRRTSKAKA
ncbi:FAD-dependent oxidoreductase [Sulfurirhabdus autotrophica]|uniref:Dihydrolipoamide acetyltransferase component of pyruvate dehydrogenase complex n=1 Tax=Sulfurirhabdus autotrophica TaxID=1706046 RepID=A0A4V2W343_9PROT|nr:FAD-dependent oxidoreductase [Sulfurirhabdus autotrophica]TCV90489.1 dihydrolipoamide dehydrogenase [Sulfurirhabdus autotrophica]